MEKIFLVYLHSIGISQKKLKIIFENNDNYKKIFEDISFSSLKIFYKEKEIEKILNRKKLLNKDYINKIIEKKEIKIISIKDKNYPKNLKEISNPPFLIYLRGKIDNSPKISIIGSRKMTIYGKKSIEKFIPDLGKYFIIVSGGAMGCDSEAHLQSLKNNHKTISIIGTGIDIDYPTSNKKMYDEIVEKDGGIISIFPIGEKANPYNFPIRNEIISGIGNGVLVIESAEKSGTLITVNLALDQGKDVFSIPGDIFKPYSIGANNLIKNGNAKMVTKPEDILEEYNISVSSSDKINTKKPIFSDKIEEKIYNTLLLESLDIDEIIEKTNLNILEISTNISMLEIKGYIKKSISGKYEIK